MSCVLPFTNVEARTDGTMSVCCIMQDHAKHTDGTSMNLSKGDTLTDLRKSKWLKNLQRDFSNGKKPEACNNCWREEEAGITSKRQRENIFWQDWRPGRSTDVKEGIVLSLDLKLGNICNSKCRICSSFASSQWVAEESKWEPETAHLKKAINKQGMWPQTNNDFWTDIDYHLKHVEKLEFYGGEPLLIDKHFEILQKVIDAGRADQVMLSYNTNGSIYPEKHIDLWKQFKKVELFFSIDDVYDRFNYIRHPGNFQEVMDNFNKFRHLAMDPRNGNYDIGIFQTISIYNICDVLELTKYVHDFVDHKMPIHYNMVFTPAHNSPKALPKEAKQALTEQYKFAPDFVQPILNFMNEEDYNESALFTFIQMTKFSDAYRKENFVETFPQLYEYLKDKWDE